MVVIRNDRDVHSAATLQRSAQFSQPQGLKLRPCLLRLVQALAKRNPEANPCELACPRKIHHPAAARQAVALFLISCFIAN